MISVLEWIFSHLKKIKKSLQGLTFLKIIRVCKRNIILNVYFVSFGGTGSNPEVPHGWQRLILLIPSQLPFSGPYFVIASMA